MIKAKNHSLSTKNGTKTLFGRLDSGEEVYEYSLVNSSGASLKITTYGGTITELRVPDKKGELENIVLGFPNLETYTQPGVSFGCIIGRVAGRLNQGMFTLGGELYKLVINKPPNHLHGGINGFSRQVWNAEMNPNLPQLKLSYLSPDKEEGYPGNLSVSVTYTLTKDNQIIIESYATTDKATPLSLTNHSFFNLAGENHGTIHDHYLEITASEYTPTDDSITLLNKVEPVGANDFRRPKKLEDAIPYLLKEHGDNYFFGNIKPEQPRKVASLYEPKSGRLLETYSTEACLQFYTGKFLNGKLKGKGGKTYGPFSGLCLECQGYPNGANYPNIHDIILRPKQIYQHKTIYHFKTL